MKSVGLLIAVLVLAVLSGLLYWSNRHTPGEGTSSKPRSDASPRILSLDPADITRFAIRRKNQAELDLARDRSDQWKITAPTKLPVDQDAVTRVLSTLSGLDSNRLIEEKISDPTTYGLARPFLTLELTLKGNKTQTLLIGDETPAGHNYFAMLAGDPRVFTIAEYNKSSLDKGSSDLRDKRLLTADFDKVSQIDLLRHTPKKREEITFGRNKDAWQIQKPRPYRANTDQIEDLIRSLKDAKMEGSSETDEAKIARAFESAAPLMIARITGASGTQELEVRRAKNDSYAKSSVVPGVFKVSGTVVSGLDKPVDEFRNKKLFDFGYEDPNKIEIRDGTGSFFFTHSSSDWWEADGKKLDAAAMQALVDKLRDLSAARFLDSGFTAPSIEIRVLSNASKRIEIVSIAKSEKSYVARREHEPTLYQLSSESVEELRKLAISVTAAKLASKNKSSP